MRHSSSISATLKNSLPRANASARRPRARGLMVALRQTQKQTKSAVGWAWMKPKGRPWQQVRGCRCGAAKCQFTCKHCSSSCPTQGLTPEHGMAALLGSTSWLFFCTHIKVACLWTVKWTHFTTLLQYCCVSFCNVSPPPSQPQSTSIPSHYVRCIF